MSRVARAKAQEMASQNYFSHTSPRYGSIASMLRSFGVRYRTYGENIGKGRTAYHVHGMTMGSSAHRANILNRNFTHVGVGVVNTPTGLVVSEVFISR